MNWTDELNTANGNLDRLRKAIPDATEGFTALHHNGMAAGTLSEKDKELQALGIGIVKQCVDCIGFHVKALIALDATRAEIAETVGVAVVMGGGPAMMYGAKALEAYDQLA